MGVSLALFQIRVNFSQHKENYSVGSEYYDVGFGEDNLLLSVDLSRVVLSGCVNTWDTTVTTGIQSFAISDYYNSQGMSLWMY